MLPSSRKEPFLTALNNYIQEYVLDSYEKDPLKMEFYHGKSTIGRKNLDLTEYYYITRQYPNAHRLLSNRWVYVQFVDMEQFLHSIYKGIYTTQSTPMLKGIPTKHLFVPEILVKTDTQDTIYYI